MNHPTAADRRPRILLADDSPQIRECLARLLESAHYEVVEARDGQEALECLSRETFALLLLDLSMPELDGWQTIQHLSISHPALPVIVITAHPNQQDWIRTPGTVALFEKPLDLPLLLRTVEEIAATSAGDARTQPARRVFRYGRPRRPAAASTQRIVPPGINE